MPSVFSKLLAKRHTDAALSTNAVTQETNGVMLAADKEKIDNDLLDLNKGTLITGEGVDFDDLITPGTYYTTGGSSGSTTHSSMLHSPTNGGGGGFKLIVMRLGSEDNEDGYIEQTVFMKNGAIYRRYSDSAGAGWFTWTRPALNITTGSTNGTISVNNIDVSVYGLGSAAYTASTTYAAASHGNHVPTTETANNAKFLRNDNTWQTVTPANIGASASGHTHNYAASSSAGGSATSVALSAGTADQARHVYFGDTASTTSVAKFCYDDDLKYNPSTNNLTVTKINGVAVGSSPKFTDTDTDTKVTSTNTNPSSVTTWYPICSTASATETNTAVKNSYISFPIRTGTTSTAGYSRLYLGNSTTSGTANNSIGSILLYNDKTVYAHILAHAGDTTSRTIYMPKASGTLVCHTTDTAVGGSTTPVYISAAGVATACSYTLGKSVPSDAVFTDTNTKVTNTLGTTTKFYLCGTTSSTTNTGTQYFDTGIYSTTTAGRLYCGSLQLSSGIILS